MSSIEIAQSEHTPARWLHRFAVLAVLLVWPLIWIGGLVTTYDAGMAVPDWPNTYGYNLFLYPYKTWLFGPFDLFIEHGHRLLGAVVGMVAIGIVILAFRTEDRRWIKLLAIGLLIAVIVQGLLGGMRVRLGDRTLAMVHGCVGPAFFAICVGMMVVTGRWWHNQHPPSGLANREPTALAAGVEGTTVASARPEASAYGSDGKPDSSGLPKGEYREVGRLHVLLFGSLVAISYAQLVLGAQLRHAQPDLAPGRFTMTVALHVVTAFLLWVLTALVWRSTRRCGDLTLSRPAVSLIGLVGIQILLGLGTWVVSYGWPNFLSWMPGATGFLLRSKGFFDSGIVTAHVATGSLILGVATLGLVRLLRVRWCRMHSNISIS